MYSHNKYQVWDPAPESKQVGLSQLGPIVSTILLFSCIRVDSSYALLPLAIGRIAIGVALKEARKLLPIKALRMMVMMMNLTCAPPTMITKVMMSANVAPIADTNPTSISTVV
jgi:hypothetical protein